MKRKIFILFILLTIIISSLTTGCKKKIEEKIAEKIIEGTTGGKVDINKDTTTIKTEQGETKVGENLKWPKDFFKDVPELEGKITQVSSGSPQDKFVYIEYVTKENALDYIEKLKDLGFVDSPSESISEGYLNYQAGNEKGEYIVFDWSDNGYATISLVKAE